MYRSLLKYFRQKPARILYICGMLIALGFFLYWIALQMFEAEIFAKLVANPDHRMTAADPHFDGLNSDNIRSAHEAIDIKDSDFNIIVLGDSYTYGFLLKPHMSPPAQLENILREKYQRSDINVINFGWTTSSPYLSYRLLKQLGKKYQPDLILMNVDMSDYRDEIFYKSVILQRGFYHYVVRFPRMTHYIRKVFQRLEPFVDWHTTLWGYPGSAGYFIASQSMEESRPMLDDLYDTLLLLNEYSRNELHAPFYVLLPPRHWQYTNKESPQSWENGSFDVLGPYVLENYRYFDEKRQGTPFPLISFLDDFRNTKEFPLNFIVDSHWNRPGARFFAERVAERCDALGAFDVLQAPIK